MMQLIRAGDSKQTASARIMVATRREKYGPTGLSEAGSERIRAAARRWVLSRPRVTICRHGHRYTVENTYVNVRGRKVCRACATIRRHRARWQRLCAQKLVNLRRAMLRAHPDVGGTARQFIAARRRYLAAMTHVA